MYEEVSWWGKVTCCLPMYVFMIYAYECNSTVAPHTYTVPWSISLFSVLESSTPIAQVSHGTQALIHQLMFQLCCTYVLFLLLTKRAGVWEKVWENVIYIKPPIKKRAWISIPFLSRKLTFVCELIWSWDEFSINEVCRVIIMACSTLNIVTIPYLY